LEHVADPETWVLQMKDPPRGTVRRPAPQIIEEEDQGFQTFFAEFQQGVG
jgi:hypothetical protein